MPQGTPVDFDGFANMQNLIDSWRKRLCFQASPETRGYAEDFKVVLHEVFPELADVLVPNCLYRCGCPEMDMCKQRYFENYLMYHAYGSLNNSIDGVNDDRIARDKITNIQNRYDIYNEWFYNTHPFKKEDFE